MFISHNITVLIFHWQIQDATNYMLCSQNNKMYFSNLVWLPRVLIHYYAHPAHHSLLSAVIVPSYYSYILPTAVSFFDFVFQFWLWFCLCLFLLLMYFIFYIATTPVKTSPESPTTVERPRTNTGPGQNAPTKVNTFILFHNVFNIIIIWAQYLINVLNNY